MCKICELIKSDKCVYKDDLIAVVPSPSPACRGHFLVVPIEHKVILEQLQDKTFATMMVAANKLAALLFDLLNAEGTNIIVRNGIPAGQDIDHISVEVIPRFTNDGIDLSWKGNKIDRDTLSKVGDELRSALEQLSSSPKKGEEKEIKKEKERKIKKLRPRIP